MMIHQVIRERRRLLGLTQEEVAECLGVTTPAVNKWEKGNTCPDITLLPPLARLLQTDLNTLFGFYEEITDQERIRFCRDVRETVMAEGLPAGFELAQEKLRMFPNSDRLLHDFALLLQGLLTMETDENKVQPYLAQIDDWYARLSESDEPTIRNSAGFLLASRALSDGQYERAQGYLERIPNRHDTPDKRLLQANLWSAQGRIDDAARLMQQALLGAVNDVQMILLKLLEIELAAGNREGAETVADRGTQLAKLFDLNPYNAVIAPFLIAQADDDTERMLSLLRRMLEALSAGWRAADSPLYRNVQIADSGAAASMIKVLLCAIEQEERFCDLRESPEYRTMRAEFQE